MDRIEDLLHRIRDSRQLAAVLFSLPDVHRELGGEPGLLAALIKRPTIVKGSGPWKPC
jgi:hypothetical protein